MIANGSGNEKIRVNVYPLHAKLKYKPSLAFGLTNGNDFYIGFNINMPLGLGSSNINSIN